MTPAEARAILALPADHDDATIRDAARLLIEVGSSDEIKDARRFLSFGLRHTGKDTHGTR
ncbi:hypothetical protein SAMN05216376_105217 [Mameliella alba]|uniref:hypothetical protein n=1 Tax=Mameliella alba TaxID=561184 RepID=UPI0008820629|nr:hypothetical protein [Mameliella alba]OWV48267.1 hypothetical protein CDZ96_10645 [Mameliella alba]PTR40308.1 hypothetical protein LX94_01790 [Mameliella alba]GGF43976.1 hypothetical protein GCM10011319_02190 [Mameliella alba]SDC98933.1 hypothetical protein SAMN05216376_105217 [Mameliella alba]